MELDVCLETAKYLSYQDLINLRQVDRRQRYIGHTDKYQKLIHEEISRAQSEALQIIIDYLIPVIHNCVIITETNVYNFEYLKRHQVYIMRKYFLEKEYRKHFINSKNIRLDQLVDILTLILTNFNIKIKIRMESENIFDREESDNEQIIENLTVEGYREYVNRNLMTKRKVKDPKFDFWINRPNRKGIKVEYIYVYDREIHQCNYNVIDRIEVKINLDLLLMTITKELVSR